MVRAVKKHFGACWPEFVGIIDPDCLERVALLKAQDWPRIIFAPVSLGMFNYVQLFSDVFSPGKVSECFRMCQVVWECFRIFQMVSVQKKSMDPTCIDQGCPKSEYVNASFKLG